MISSENYPDDDVIIRNGIEAHSRGNSPGSVDASNGFQSDINFPNGGLLRKTRPRHEQTTSSSDELTNLGNGNRVDGLGVNWGTMATHKLPPKTVVQMMKDNGIQRVKLFDADQSTMDALAGFGIEVMVAIPNDQLQVMTSYDCAKQWVRRNITRYNYNEGVKIK
ncbi:hypothetical protein RJ640_024435 [Escallonia rubra]|uniref:Glucan endo-1,3-beta-D-glucosidase n=1 Tax=Escallonia rubra TaxID=112253 RepID=A0AA88UNM7_9ASTE|nr:hypothetical protein RJ640_024435 [Escallonia rubra]